MINKSVLVGRITKEPELKHTQTGLSFVQFTLAVNRRFNKAEQEADFINCVTWKQSADFMGQYVKKGALLGVEGRIQTRNYKDNNDKTIYITEVVCENVQIISQQKDDKASNIKQQPEEFNQSIDIQSDDLPF